MNNKSLENQIYEITPLSDRDCFYIVERFKNEFTYPLHSHKEYELNFIQNARGVERTVGDSVEEVGDCDLVLITGSDLKHRWSQGKCNSESIREITIQFSPDVLSDNLLNKNQFDSIRHMLERAQVGIAFPQEAIMKVYAMLDTLVQDEGFYAVIKFLSMLHELSLFKNAKTLSSSSFARIDSPTDSRRIGKVCEYIKENYSKEIRLAQLAEMIGMTPVAFSRFFGRRVGRSLSDYIIDIRLGHVSRMLVDSTHSISEVCFECGFNNLSNFNRIFRSKKGCSPKEFRENYKKIKRLI